MKYVYKSKVANHNEVKKQLLEMFDKIPKNSINIQNENIVHTDWSIPAEIDREYGSLFLELIKPHMTKITKDLKCSDYEVQNFWFQRYEQKNYHSWHIHPHAHFANVYFVECPKGFSTKFMHFDKECNEGDIISFPAFLPHSSPVITENTMKTIISFNTSIHYDPL